jgi:hypothetical protein
MDPIGKDPANIQAAAQEAEERKLKRKQKIQGDKNTKGVGVSFDEDAESENINPGTETSSLNDETSDDLPTQKASETTREIKIITDGTFVGTQVFVDGAKIQTSDMKIFISKTSGFICKMTQEVNLF